MKARPCRPCEKKEIKLTKRAFDALSKAASDGRVASARVKDLERTIATFVSKKPEMERLLVHRSYGEPWKNCPLGWSGGQCDEFEMEHAEFFRGVK